MPQRGAKASRASIQVSACNGRQLIQLRLGPEGRARRRLREWPLHPVALHTAREVPVWRGCQKHLLREKWPDRMRGKRRSTTNNGLQRSGGYAKSAYRHSPARMWHAISLVPKAPLLLQMSKLTKVARVDDAVSPGNNGANSRRPRSNHTHARRYTVT